MSVFLTVVHILVCLGLVTVVLLQHGKGADIGAAFGSGASNTVFGSRGAGTFLTKATTGMVVIFMITSIFLSIFSAPPTATEIIGSGTPTEAAPAPEPIAEPGFIETEPIEEPEVPSGFEAIPPPDPTDD